MLLITHPKRARRVAFVDVETTGLSAQDRIVSLGLVLLDLPANEAPDFSCAHLIFDPGRASDPRAREVHGYADKLLRQQEPFAARAAEIHASLSSADRIVAHNAKFDMGFIAREFDRASLPPLAPPVVCTMEAWRRKGPGGSASLSSICAQYGLSRIGQRHGALEDAWLAMQIYVRMAGLPVAVPLFAERTDTGPSNLRAAPAPAPAPVAAD